MRTYVKELYLSCSELTLYVQKRLKITKLEQIYASASYQSRSVLPSANKKTLNLHERLSYESDDELDVTEFGDAAIFSEDDLLTFSVAVLVAVSALSALVAGAEVPPEPPLKSVTYQPDPFS